MVYVFIYVHIYKYVHICINDMYLYTQKNKFARLQKIC